MNSDQADVFWCGFISLSLLYIYSFSVSVSLFSLSLFFSYKLILSSHPPACITYIPQCTFTVPNEAGFLWHPPNTHVTIELTHGTQHLLLLSLKQTYWPCMTKKQKTKKVSMVNVQKKTLWHESHDTHRMSHGWGPLFCCSSHQYLA